MQEQVVKKDGWKGPPGSRNTNGRPKMLTLPKRTNREIRQDELLNLLRKFKPLMTKSVQTAYKIMEDSEASDQNKLKASALLIQTYRQLLLDTFDYRYDEEKADEVQEQNVPVFSLKMINTEDAEEKIA